MWGAAVLVLLSALLSSLLVSPWALSPIKIQMLGGALASVFRRTAEDEEIDEDEFYAKKQKRMERRLQQRGEKSESGSDDDDERRRRKKHKKHHRDDKHRDERKSRHHHHRDEKRDRDDNEDDYVARSRRRKQELKQNPRVPYLHGPQEDANPIMDFIIKSHKYRNGAAEELQQRARSGGALAAARPDGGTLAQVLLDTKAFNQTEDEKQLDGAHKQLAARGSMLRPILLSQKLSMVEEDALRTSGGDEDALLRGGGSSYGHSLPPHSQQHAPPASYSHVPPTHGHTTRALDRPPADRVPQWLHDRYDANSRSRSRSRSRGRRSRSNRRGVCHHR